jgi:PBP1b-binding outer membrane lipoprotein LpoB
MTRIRTLIAALLVALVLGGCSKKSNVENGGSSTGSSGNWDSMNWDQGNWS